MGVRVGILSPDPLDERSRDALAAAANAGIDHVASVDHISFRGGDGVDGLVTVAALAGLHPTLGLGTLVYQLPLRHPLVVARQLATIALLAPGRLTFGVGVGGEDRHEYESCGVDPRTRGRRMDEHLTVLRALLAGEPVSFHGEFLHLEDARVVPTPAPPIPIVVGGRSDAAARRAGRLGDGWAAVWNSPARFSRGVAIANEAAERAGRGRVEWRHSQTFWCGFGANPEVGRTLLAAKMTGYYGTFEGFARYSPCGRAEDVAELVRPYLDAGARTVNIVPIAADLDEAIAGVAAVKRLLAS